MYLNMEQKRIHRVFLVLPSATRGALFEKTAPLDPPQKLLIKCFVAKIINALMRG
jgi:hypothetical protein